MWEGSVKQSSCFSSIVISFITSGYKKLQSFSQVLNSSPINYKLLKKIPLVTVV